MLSPRLVRSITSIAALFLTACGAATASPSTDSIADGTESGATPTAATTSVCDGQPIVVTSSGAGQGAGFLLIDGACTFYAGDGFRAPRTGALTRERASDIATALGVGDWTQGAAGGGPTCADCFSYTLRHGSLVTDSSGVPSSIGFESAFSKTLDDLMRVGTLITRGRMTVKTTKRKSNDAPAEDVAWPLLASPDRFSAGGSIDANEADKLRPFAALDRAQSAIVAHTLDGSRWDVVFADEIPFPR